MNNQKVHFSEFEQILLKNSNRLGTSVLLLLAWIAQSDGHLDRDEIKELQSIAEATNHMDEINILLQIASQSDLNSLQLASEIIKMNFKNDKSKLFIEMSIGVAIADGYLKTSENHILKFLSDLVDISSEELHTIFKNMTGKPFPEADDLSSALYWQYRNNERKKRSSQESAESSAKQEQVDPKRIKALSILGLDEEASITEIKNAFKRLAKIHHPDRFVSLGDEAVQAATHTFKRILSAYEYLTNHA